MPLETSKADISSLRIHRTESNTAPGRNWKPVIYSAVAVVVILIGILLFSSGLFSSPEVVQTGTVSLTYPGQAGSVLTASGYVVASRKAAVGTKGTGRLVWLGVEEGSIVKKDQIIGRLESNDVQASHEQAEASLLAAKANLESVRASLENADSVYRRTKSLFSKHVVAQADLTTAESQFKQLQSQAASSAAQVNLAEKTVLAAGVQVEFTNIRAPFDGTVLTKDADVGDVITPFGAASGSRGDIVMLADMSSLDAEVDVSESNLEQVHVGQPCEITLDAVPDKRYKGRVHMIVPTADRSKATVLTKVSFLDIDARVLPEMSLKVLFLKDSAAASDTSGPKLTVPAAAIVTKGTQKLVYVVHGDHVFETAVVLGEAMGSGIVVTQGLTNGDKVVLSPTDKIHAGARIKLEE